MRRTNPKNRTALILSLAAWTLAPNTSAAKVTDAETLALFTPEVARCLESGAPADCDPHRLPLAACAKMPAVDVCAPILADPAATLADPQSLDRVRGALAAFGETEMTEAAPPADPRPEKREDRPAKAEKRRDKAADAPSEAPAQDAPAAAQADGEKRPKQPNRAEKQRTDAEKPRPGRDVPPQAETAAPAVDTPQDDAPKARPKRDADAEARPKNRPPRDTAAPSGADDPATATTATEAGETSLPTTLPASPPASEPVTEADAQARAAEAARLLREAEATAPAPDVAPEVVEEAITEAAPRPAEDPAPQLDAQTRARVEELSRQPEVAAALDVLGAALGQADAPPAPPATEAAPAEVVEETIADTAVRRSTDDFDSRLSLQPETAAPAETRSRGERDLERAGLAALGALAIGMMVNDNRVVARADDRVIVQDDEGALRVWRDDDAILRSDGGTRRIERYADGRTITEWQRDDGSRVRTLRDATGRVLSRERVLADGTIVPLFDEAARVEPIDVSTLPEMRYRELRLGAGTDPDRALALLDQAESEARALDRSFSLRQIRDARPVRELVPVLSPDPITFETGRANIRADEVPKLLQVGRLIERLLDRDPSELFLIEGHTDAVGAAAYNLGLSDRRAESVALALTEFFRIPPENLIVQGYGEGYLRVATDLSEERNRRVVMRRITPLLPQ